MLKLFVCIFCLINTLSSRFLSFFFLPSTHKSMMRCHVLLVTSIRSTSDIQVGSIVETNGLGEVFPSGIYVGEVVAIINDDLGVSKILKVKPKSSLEDIRYVMVLGRGEHH